MRKCGSCWLQLSMRTVNLLINLIGAAVIVYSLWLQKKWNGGVAELPCSFSISKPWFIYACLGVGIAVCLSALGGHMVANCISTNCVLYAYVFAIVSLMLLQVAVVITIYFKIDWTQEIFQYIDEKHQKFKMFAMFHLEICRLIVITILVPQISVLVLATSLCIVGTEPLNQPVESSIPDFNCSFLVPNSTSVATSAQTCRRCDILQRRVDP